MQCGRGAGGGTWWGVSGGPYPCWTREEKRPIRILPGSMGRVIIGGGCWYPVGGAWAGGSSSCLGLRSFFLMWVSLSLLVLLVVELEEAAEVGGSCPLLLFGLWGLGSSRLESFLFFLSVSFSLSLWTLSRVFVIMTVCLSLCCGETWGSLSSMASWISVFSRESLRYVCS